MLWTTHSVTALALFTCASWADWVGHLGIKQSLPSIREGISKKQALTWSSSYSDSRHRPAGLPDTHSLSRSEGSKLRESLSQDSTRLNDIKKDSARVNDVTEDSTPINDVTEDSTPINDVTEVSTQVNDDREVSTQEEGVAEVSTQEGGVAEISTQVNGATDVSTQFSGITEASNLISRVTSATNLINDIDENVLISDIKNNNKSTPIESIGRPPQAQSTSSFSNRFIPLTDVNKRTDVTTSNQFNVNVINTQLTGITKTRSQLSITRDQTSDITRANSTQLNYVRGTDDLPYDVMGSTIHSNDVREERKQSDDIRNSIITHFNDFRLLGKVTEKSGASVGSGGGERAVDQDEVVATTVVTGAEGATEIITEVSTTVKVIAGVDEITEAVTGIDATTDGVTEVETTMEVVTGIDATTEAVTGINETTEVAKGVDETLEAVTGMDEITKSATEANETVQQIKMTMRKETGMATVANGRKTNTTEAATEDDTVWADRAYDTMWSERENDTMESVADIIAWAERDNDTMWAERDDETVWAERDDETVWAESDNITIGPESILDEHGFVVSHSEEEQLDQEDDLKIYEAVVTSMAQWELHKLNKMNKKRVRRDEEVVCYMDLGCFRDEGPFDYLDMLPSPPEEINTRFLLYTRERGEREKVIKPHNISTIFTSHFNTSRPTKLLIHGFGSSCHSVWIREMRVALLAMMDVNIICVNWHKGAEVPNYVRAASNTRLVGRQVALLIETLNARLNTTLDDFHLIGFSLGAHVSGHAGARLKNLSRISGLDPAGPLFESYSPSVRLDHTDARFVDVIHTNADSLLMGGLGAFEPMGHVDFYPNGGRMQKGCANLFVGGVSDILWPTEGDGRYLCNHRRGYKYYLNSVAPICTFPAFVCRDYETFLKGDCFPCESCGNMGYFSDKAEGRGQLYLVTRDTEPFCANQYKVTVHHSGGPPAEPVTTYGRLDITFIAADGINETLQISQSEDTVLEAGQATVRILVPHPAITDIQAVQLRYTAYHGWIYSGFSRWAIDKISLMDSFGKMLSFCHRGTTLISGKAMHLTLLPGDCVLRDEPTNVPAKPHPFSDSLPEETENEVHQMPSLQLAVAPHEVPHNLTVPHRVFNLTHPIPTPILTPIDAHATVLTHQGQAPPLSVSLEVAPNYQNIPNGFYNVSMLRPPHLPHIFPAKLPSKTPHPSRYGMDGSVVTSPVPGMRYSVGGTVVMPTTPVTDTRHGDVAMSSEEPVNVIPAPDLAHFPLSSNFSQAPTLYKHENGHTSSTIKSPDNTLKPGSVQESSSVQALVQLHSIPAVTSSSSQNHTQNHSVAVSGAQLTTDNPTSTLRVPTTPSISLLPPTTSKASSAVPSTNLDIDMNSLASNIKTPDVSSNNTDFMLNSTTNPITPKNSFQSPLSTLVMPNSQDLRSETISPTLLPSAAEPTPSVMLSDKPHWLSISHFSGENTDRVDIVPPALLVHPSNFHSHSPLPATTKTPSVQAEFSDRVPTALNTNSLIDEEVPERERARALELGPEPISDLSSDNSRVKCSSSSCSIQSYKQRAPSLSSTSYSSVRTQTTNSHASNLTPPQPSFHQLPPQKISFQADPSQEPHFKYPITNVENSQATGIDTSSRLHQTRIFSSANNLHLRFPSSGEDQIRPLTHHDVEGRPRLNRGHLPATYLDNPLRPPPIHNLPPETIIGHGRAPQPTLEQQTGDQWMLRQSYQQESQMDHDMHNVQEYEQKSYPEEYEETSPSQYQHHHHITQHQQQQQYSHHNHPQQHHRSYQYNAEQQQYHTRSQHIQKPSEQHSLTGSIGNLTHVNVELAPERSPRPIPAPAPFYVQLLPPTFSHLAHLETFSLPRETRKPQDSHNRKRGNSASGRANRGRSLSIPAPGGRAAVFTPLVLQVQENHQGRYIPLRHIPGTSHAI